MHPRYSFTLALLAAFPAIAADKEAETVVVTATRFSEVAPGVAANVSVITRQDISNTPAQNLPDVLSTRAGIDVRQIGGAMGRDAVVDMRGFGATATSNTLILVDGLRVNPVDMGGIIWSAIPLDSVERIEIMRGSGTVLYGDGASGGVINIITNKSGSPVAGVTATLGDFGYKGSEVQLGNGNDTAYYNLFVNYAAADGYRKNSQQDQQSANGRVGWLLDGGEVYTDFAIYKESAGQPGSVFTAAYRDDPRSTRTPHNSESRDGYRIRPGVSYRLHDRLTLEGEFAFDHQQLNTKYFSAFGATASDRLRDTNSLTPRLRWRHDLVALPSETVFGYDYYDGKVTSDNTGFANQGAAQESSAFYMQNITKFTQNLSLTLGGRNQRMKQKAHQDAYAPFFSPAVVGETTRTKDAYDLGLAYAADGWRIYGKTGTTFRFANVDELFGFDAFFNPVFAGDIKPQHGRINEIGGDIAVGPANLRASFYQLDLTDEIGFDGTANVNLDPTRRKGIELEAGWKMTDSLQAKASYTYADARFREGAFSGNAIPLVPRDQASALLTWNTGPTGSYTAAARYVGERRYSSDFANTRRMLSGYTTFDMQSVWKLKPWRITAKLLNALDRKYSSIAGYSTFYSDTYYYPADRRSIFVSARYDF
ncbi:TonB-dependent receptor [Propionivibrio sp.]|uniref:TonB-dependent receptor n=1 Tax=Propionivibrio sp. TaxID=2212460 RepID=UPI002623ACDF|nr:TonB-dependent receptor [Propionivibrio sp.]